MTPIDLRKFVQKLSVASSIPPERFFEIIKDVNGDPFAVATAVVRRRWLERERVGMMLGDAIGKTYLDLSTTLFQSEAVDLLTKEFALRYKAIPVYKLGNTVTVAVARPLDAETVKTLKMLVSCPLDTVMSFEDEIDTAIKLNYDVSDNIDVDELNKELQSISSMSDESLANYKPVVEFADKLLLLSIKEGVSDIHIEPKETHCAVRFRTDGMLKEKISLKPTIATALISRLKVMSRMDIAEKRKPQDGRIKFETPVKDIDVRVNSLPTLNGEKIVMRLLGSLGKDIPLNIDRLNLSNHVRERYKKVLHETNGMILVTGPTGSGKTTTLYGSLNFIDDPHRNITTLEDPVEYVVPTFNQSNVNEKAGRTFASLLRAMLRQDPDIVLVGEIRDLETASIAAQAALTGHLVLSSLHTNSALQALTRFADMGVSPHVLAPALKAVLAQRLVRRLCEFCKEPVKPLNKEYLGKHVRVDIDINEPMPTVYEARGCKHCGQTGYSGRLGIHELLVIDQDMQDLVIATRPLADLRRRATEKGFIDMKKDGFVKVFQGLTTFDEVRKATSQ